jgi:Lrp/AsnC family transcriptional regulator
MSEKIQLSLLDRRIIRALQQDATLSGQDLADTVSSSTASCWRRIKSLEEAGVIRKTVCLVDRDAIDKNVDVLCLVRLKSHSEIDALAFEELVHGHENIVECYTVTGEWDYMVRVVCTDISDYDNFLKKILLRHPSVSGANSTFALSRIKYTTEVPL